MTRIGPDFERSGCHWKAGFGSLAETFRQAKAARVAKALSAMGEKCIYEL
jgi:hypothetical protein